MFMLLVARAFAFFIVFCSFKLELVVELVLNTLPFVSYGNERIERILRVELLHSLSAF